MNILHVLIEALEGSQVKIKGNDVIATWKLLTALVFVPILFLVYAILVYIVSDSLVITLIVSCCLPICSVTTLFLADQAFDSFLSLYPLYLSVCKKTGITQIRHVLAQDIQALINELGPLVFKDFENKRHVKLQDLNESFKEK